MALNKDIKSYIPAHCVSIPKKPPRINFGMYYGGETKNLIDKRRNEAINKSECYLMLTEQRPFASNL